MEMKEFFQRNVLKCVAAGFLLGVLVCGAGSLFNTVSGSPAFCGTCHAMKDEAATFADSSHRNLECTECHLPHANMAVYMTAKAKTGMVDAYHETIRDYPAHIRLSAEGRNMVNENCLRCHEATMGGVYHAANGENSDCLKCHSRIAHGSNHLEGGVNVE